MKAAYRKILQELMKRQPIPREIKEKHDDIEDAIAKAGGARGKLRAHG